MNGERPTERDRCHEETVTGEAVLTREHLPEHIGKYHIKRVIASGGMGTVYEATQDNPRRVVAVKVMKQGISSKSALRRFEYEGQILGRLRHPGIAQIYEAGTYDPDPSRADQSRGRKPADIRSPHAAQPDERVTGLAPGALTGAVPYFAMEYIPNAKTITKYADEKKLGTRQRMELFAKVCDAIHHGHQKGIIHRDLKPSNILVDSTGQVKIIDFGVARCTDSDLAVTTLQTDVGQLIGTLQYMSPEQCEGDPHDIDTRSDVYALGIVFYQLLCGKLPYDVTRMAMHQATRAIREQHPTKLSTMDKTLRGDVETIALKALEKERERRYQSAADFGHDIHRYLTGEAIAARRASIVYQLRLFARRNKAVFASLAAVFIVLVGGIIVSTSLYLRAEHARIEQNRERERAELAERDQSRERQRAEQEAQTSKQVTEFLVGLFAVSDPSESRGNTITAREILDKGADKIREELKDQPLIQGTLMNTIGRVYRALGLYEPAHRLLETALTIRREHLGNDHLDVAVSLHDLSELLWVEHEGTASAEAVAREALRIRRKLLGNDHPSVAESLSGLAYALYAQSRKEEAAFAAEEALAIRRKLFGNQHPDVAKSMNDLGVMLVPIGQYERAEGLQREALAIQRELLGNEHDAVAESLHDLAITLSAARRFQEAVELGRESVAIGRKTLGNDHPELGATLNMLGQFAIGAGDYEEAERAQREALEIFRRRYGDDHPMTNSVRSGLAFVLLHVPGKLEEAETLLREGLASVRPRYADDPLTSSDAWVAFLVGRLRSHLGECLTKMLRYAEAERELLESFRILEIAEGREHEKQKLTIKRLEQLYDAWDAAEPGQGYAEKAAEWRSKLEETPKP